MRVIAILVAMLALATPAYARPSNNAIDAEVARLMTATSAKGLAVALVENGKVAYVKSYGVRNTARAPLETNTIMYGASLTKAAFAYMVMQLVEEGLIALDTPIAKYLPKPLPDYPTEEKYAPWVDLKGDDRWRKLTPRILLTHSSGFHNFAFFEPDGSCASTSIRARATRTPAKA